MTTGSQVLQSFEARLSRERKELTAVQAQGRTISSDIASTQRKMGEHYLTLAQIYLPSIDDTSTLESVVREKYAMVHAANTQRLREIDVLEKERQTIEAELETLRNQKKPLDERLMEASTTVHEARVARERDLTSRADYQTLVANGKATEHSVTRTYDVIRRATEFASQEIAKFEGLTMFVYLQRLESRGVEIKGMNGFVARAIHYRELKKRYASLKAIPEIAENMKGEVVQAQGALALQLRAIEDEVGAKYSIESKKLAEASAKRGCDDIESQLRSRELRYNQAGSQITDLENVQGSRYAKMISEVQSFLSSKGVEDLRARARMTPDPRDDNLVEQIDLCNRNIADYQGQSQRNVEAQRAQQAVIDKLQTLCSQFKSRDYDHSRSRFNSFDDGRFLEGYLVGSMSMNDLNRYHHREPEPVRASVSIGSSNDNIFGGSSGSITDSIGGGSGPGNITDSF